MDATNGVPALQQALIGPNAVIRMGEALTALEGAPVATRIFQAAGIERYLTQAPTEMIPAYEVANLHRAVHSTLGDARARTAGWVAGQRTADYLLENRIPSAVKKIMPYLPAWAGARILCKLIQRNAWTFVGGGKIHVWYGNKGALVMISGNPLCQGSGATEPWCDFYAATFERLFAQLVHNSTRVRETHCTAMGAPDCIFEIAWPGFLRARPPAARLAAAAT